MDYKEFYNQNKNFKDYVDRYCAMYGYTLEEALTHEMVKLTAEYYRRLEEEKE